MKTQQYFYFYWRSQDNRIIDKNNFFVDILLMSTTSIRDVNKILSAHNTWILETGDHVGFMVAFLKTIPHSRKFKVVAVNHKAIIFCCQKHPSILKYIMFFIKRANYIVYVNF